MSDKLEREINRGDRARRLLADEIISEAKAHIEAEFHRLYDEAGPRAIDDLQFIKSMQYMHGKYFKFFERVVIDGKMAKLKIEVDKKTLKERIFG